MPESEPQPCAGKDCPNTNATLKCPTCLKNGKDVFFCSQDCFKKNWVRVHAYKFPINTSVAYILQSEHKKLHPKSQSTLLSKFVAPKVVSDPDPTTGHFNPFPTFPFTGDLRPVYPLSPRREVPKTIQLPDYAKDGIPHSEQVFTGRHKIKILNQEEIEGMRKACRLGREVLDIAAAAAKPGVTTDYIDEIVHKACIERDVRRPAILPYGTSPRKLTEGSATPPR